MSKFAPPINVCFSRPEGNTSNPKRQACTKHVPSSYHWFQAWTFLVVEGAGRLWSSLAKSPDLQKSPPGPWPQWRHRQRTKDSTVELLFLTFPHFCNMWFTMVCHGLPWYTQLIRLEQHGATSDAQQPMPETSDLRTWARSAASPAVWQELKPSSVYSHHAHT